MDLGVRGKRALVTGSTAGIGRATADILAAEGAIAFLASASGSYVNGINLAVDGSLLKSI